MNPYPLSDDTRLCLLQARFETLQQGNRELGPAHLVLGVLKRLSDEERRELLEVEQFEALCTALGATARPAPLSTDDISYAAAAEEAIAGGIAAALGRHPDSLVEPYHLLLGVHHPRRLVEQTATPPSEVAAVLAAAGLDPARLRDLIARSSPRGNPP